MPSTLRPAREGWGVFGVKLRVRGEELDNKNGAACASPVRGFRMLYVVDLGGRPGLDCHHLHRNRIAIGIDQTGVDGLSVGQGGRVDKVDQIVV